MIKTVGFKVIVKKFEKGDKKVGNIIIPAEEENPLHGVVIAIGEKVTDVEVDDIVLFNMLTGNQVIFEEEAFLVLKESDLIAKIDL